MSELNYHYYLRDLEWKGLPTDDQLKVAQLSSAEVEQEFKSLHFRASEVSL